MIFDILVQNKTQHFWRQSPKEETGTNKNKNITKPQLTNTIIYIGQSLRYYKK